jgi:gamma-glutamyltranspeptidase/glutathione hydrolase
MYLDENGNPSNTLSRDGASASGIPGSVAGMFEILKYATLPMAKLIQPAIDLAAYGYVITEKEARGLNATRAQFLKNSSAPSAFTQKEQWKAGDTLVQTDLANTLTRIQKNGLAGFYEGETADLIVKEMSFSKGIISLEDLKNYRPKYRTPLEFDYRGHHIISFSPPSSGGILIAQMLQMIQPYDIQKMGLNTPAEVSLMVEAQRRAYADRAEHMGDPDFYKVPTKTLISNQYAQDRMKDYQVGVAGQVKIFKQVKRMKVSKQHILVLLIQKEIW